MYSLKCRTPSIKKMFENSLKTNSYNSFSNQQSAELTGEASLETASIQMLKAVGGGTQYDLLAGANGDLSSNEMAAFDPMFFLIMANVDRFFWIWQNKFGRNSSFTIDTSTPSDKGIKTKYGQGPSPNQSGEEILNNESKLFPCKVSVNQVDDFTKVKDVVDIENQLNYTYSNGSLDKCIAPGSSGVVDGNSDVNHAE